MVQCVYRMRRLYTATKKGDLIMQNHPGWYYGEEFGGIRRKKPGNPKLFTLDDFYGALRIAWSRDTAYSGCQVDWEPSDPSYGQCAVTAMLAYDLFGGDICRVRNADGSTHYFNRIDGHIIDLTAEQLFQPFSYEPYEVMNRQYCGKNSDTKRRYQLLVERVAEALAD